MDDSARDFSVWFQSVVDYMRDAPTSCIDLQHLPCEARDKDLQPVFDALVGSDVTELHIMGTTSLPNKLQHFCGLLNKTKIRKLSISSCDMTSHDFVSLMAVLKDARITDLNLSNNYGVRLKSAEIKTFIAHLVNSHVTSLNLSHSRISHTEKLPHFFRRLPDTLITRLNLRGFFCFKGHSTRKNCIKSLFILVSNLQNTVITDLDLGSSELGDDLAKTVGPFLGKSKLEKLGLSSVELTDFGVDILVPGLIKSKTNHLDLSFNEINGDTTLGRRLKQMKIKVLDLSRNLITNKKFFSGFNFLQGSNVGTLLIGKNRYYNRGKLPLKIKTLRFSKLISVALNQYIFNLEQFTALVNLLSNTNLTQISLIDNDFSGACFRALGECLIKSKFKHINLSWSARSGIDYTSCIASLIEKTKGSKVLSINLSFDELDFGANIIAQRLAGTTFLILDLEQNRPTDDIGSMAEQLKFTSVVALNLSTNHIGDDGAAVLAKYLGDTNIVTLSLRCNSITSRGAIFLAQVLGQTRLRHLDLSENHIENNGLESLAEYAKNSCATHINVEGNYGGRTLLVYSVMWDNRKKLKIFADLLKRTAFYTGRRNCFESNQDLVDVEVLIDDCLKLYKMVAKEPWLVTAIEQDKFILDLKNVKRFDCWHCEVRVLRPCLYDYVDFFIDDCA